MPHDRKDVHVVLDNIDFFNNAGAQGMVLFYHGNIGWGEYTLWKTPDGEYMCDSEYMETADDRWFLKLLLDQLRELVTVSVE